MQVIKSAALALGLGASLAAAVTPLEVRGNSFVNPKTGNKFQVVGVAYQPGGSAGYNPELKRDPLSNPDICMRDAALMQRLGINAIRVYNLDPNLNHDACASIFNAAGMYLLLDVNSPLVGESLHTFEPWTSYYAAYLNRTFAIVEAFHNYPNTLLFFSGNEVISDVKSAEFVPPYLRAVTRDIKNYIKKHIPRKIPVGYSAADVRDVLFDTWNYLQCSVPGEADDASRVDIFALNSYSWCGRSSFKESGYDVLINGFRDSSVPVFFSEYGCNRPAPRIFTEVGSIHGPEMTGVMSGGIVYEYTEEPNNYGLVKLSTDGTAQLLPDYHALAAQYQKLDFTALESGKPAANTPTPPRCASNLITEVGFNNNFTVPRVPGDGSQDIIDNGVNPKPKGQLIQITDWNVKLPVKDVDGTIITGLAVKPLADDASNAPGTNTGGSSGNATSGGDDKKDAGAYVRPAMLLLALPLALAALFV